MFKMGKVQNILLAAAGGAMLGAGASSLVQRIPTIGAIPMIGIGAGFLVAMAAGKKFGGRNGAMMGAVGFLVSTGALGALLPSITATSGGTF